MKYLNKTVAKFIYKGKPYEIDELMDSGSREDGFGEYDVFCGKEYVAHICTGVNEAPDLLIKQAKWELENNPLNN